GGFGRDVHGVRVASGLVHGESSGTYALAFFAQPQFVVLVLLVAWEIPDFQLGPDVGVVGFET
ncbi:MAG: hypothetical protein ACR2G1_08065, partial [Rubrobacteraceae bacterium]